MIGAILILLAVGFILTKFTRGDEANLVNSSQNEEQVATVLATKEVNFEHLFKAKNGLGAESGELTFRITKVEKTKEVLVQGRPANAKGDKAFLVLNVEIDNSDVEKKYISPVDILRLIDNTDKKFAPDIHSDVVEVQPISTKISRVGFVILEGQNEFTLQIGELEGEKQNLEINF